MRLRPDWRYVLKKAWSIKWMGAAAVLSTAEILLPFWAEDFPRGVFAGLTVLAVVGGLVARLMAQREMQ